MFYPSRHASVAISRPLAWNSAGCWPFGAPFAADAGGRLRDLFAGAVCCLPLTAALPFSIDDVLAFPVRFRFDLAADDALTFSLALAAVFFVDFLRAAIGTSPRMTGV